MQLDDSRLPALVWCVGSRYVFEIHSRHEDDYLGKDDKYLTNDINIHNTAYRIIYLSELQEALPEYFI